MSFANQEKAAQKEPAEIGMREIALDCLEQINGILERAAENADSPKQKVLDSIRAFRGCCLKNPRVASLVMEKIVVLAG